MKPGSTAEILAALRARLERPERGEHAAARSTPAGRVPAGVGVLLHPGGRGLETLMIKRPGTMRHHAREVAFPGGRPEAADGGNLVLTALRETREELGLDGEDLTPLGPLTPVPTATSTFLLHPFAIALAPHAQATPHPGEVDVLIRLPLEDFFAGRLPYRAVEFAPGRRSPIFDFDAGSMYGASAHILEELLAIYGEVRDLPMRAPQLTDEIPWQ